MSTNTMYQTHFIFKIKPWLLSINVIFIIFVSARRAKHKCLTCGSSFFLLAQPNPYPSPLSLYRLNKQKGV